MFTAVLAFVFAASSHSVQAATLTGAQVKKINEIKEILAQSRARAWNMNEKALKAAQMRIVDTESYTRVSEVLYDLTQKYLTSLSEVEYQLPRWLGLNEAARLQLQLQAVREGAVLLRKLGTDPQARGGQNYLQLRILSDRIQFLSMTRPKSFFFAKTKQARRAKAEIEAMASQGVNTTVKNGTQTFLQFAKRLEELSSHIAPEACLEALRSVDDADLHEILFAEPISVDFEDFGPPDWSQLEIPVPLAQK